MKKPQAGHLSYSWLLPAIGGAALLPALALAAEPLPTTPLGRYYVPPARNVAFNFIQRGSYDTNPLKLANNAESLAGTESIGTLKITSKTPTSLLSSESSVTNGLYDNSDFNTTNFNQLFRLEHKNDRWDVGADARYIYDTTRSTELTSYGITAPNVRHKQKQFNPRAGVRINGANRIGLSASFTESEYDNRSFIDYQRDTLTPNWQYKVTDAHTAILSYNIERFKSLSGTPIVTDTTGPSIGWITRYNDRLNTRFTGGFEDTEQSRFANNNARTSKQRNFVFTGQLTYIDDVQQLRFDASRAQQPTGNGVSGLFTTLSLSEDYVLNQRVSLRGNATYRNAKYARVVSVNLDTEYSGSAGIAYRLYQNLDLTGNYQYTRQKLTIGAGTVNAQTFMVGLSLHPFEKEF